MPSHYLNQGWNIVSWTLGNKLWKPNRNLYIFFQENAFENVIWKMTAIFLSLNMLKPMMTQFSLGYIYELVQDRRNSSALAMQLHLSCTNPWIYKPPECRSRTVKFLQGDTLDECKWSHRVLTTCRNIQYQGWFYICAQPMRDGVTF